MSLVACDISYYQPPVDDSYPHQWLIFRCCDGTYHDPNCDRNAQWCANAVQTGRMVGWTAYVVYRPGQNQAILNHVATLPAGGHVMIDVESWSGEIVGDHSGEINQLAAALEQTHPGRVWCYSNRYDLAAIYPNRTVPVVLASYGGSRPDVPNLIGWQYTDGTYTVPGLPNATPPFGACDHNELYLTAETTSSAGAVQIPGEGMSSTEYQQLSKQIADLRTLVAQVPVQTQARVHADMSGTMSRVVQILSFLTSDRISQRAAQYLSGGLPLPGAGNNIPGAEKVITANITKALDDLQATLLAAVAAHTTTVTASGTVDLAPITTAINAIRDELTALSRHLGGTP